MLQTFYQKYLTLKNFSVKLPAICQTFHHTHVSVQAKSSHIYPGIILLVGLYNIVPYLCVDCT